MACLIHKSRLALSLHVLREESRTPGAQDKAGGQCWEAPDDPKPAISQPKGKTGLGLSTEKGKQA